MSESFPILKICGDSNIHHKIAPDIIKSSTNWTPGGGKRPWSPGPALAADPGGGHQLRLQDRPHPSSPHHGAGCPEGRHDGNPGAWLNSTHETLMC